MLLGGPTSNVQPHCHLPPCHIQIHVCAWVHIYIYIIYIWYIHICILYIHTIQRSNCAPRWPILRKYFPLFEICAILFDICVPDTSETEHWVFSSNSNARVGHFEFGQAATGGAGTFEKIASPSSHPGY